MAVSHAENPVSLVSPCLSAQRDGNNLCVPNVLQTPREEREGSTRGLSNLRGALPQPGCRMKNRDWGESRSRGNRPHTRAVTASERDCHSNPACF